MEHKLENHYKFYLLCPDNLVSPPKDWFDTVKEIGQFNDIDHFWALYQHLVRPEQLAPSCEFILFKNNIQPQWEDKENQNGGRFKLRVKKQFSNKFWEDVVLTLIGEQFCHREYVNGVVATIKEREVIISLWVKQHDEQTKKSIKDWLRDLWGLVDKIDIDYRDHPKLENIIQ